MPRDLRRVYPWPASAITPEDMALLHAARERTSPHVPITRLLAYAIRTTFNQAADLEIKEAA